MDLPESQGANPYFLLFVEAVYDGSLGSGQRHTTVDLDEPGWMAKHGHFFREVVDMHLCRKDTQVIVFSVHLDEGEQGYYVGRHVANTGISREAIAYGIGKKRVDGNEDNLWVLPWGQVCAGKDVERFALEGLRAGLG